MLLKNDSSLADKLQENIQAAREAGLRYSSVDDPGITRVGKPGHFSFRDASGKAVRDAQTLARIKSLVLPPAWTKVWICAQARGHLQATGFDQRGRKQYRYHPDWRKTRDENKYERMIAFAQALPKIRRRVRRDLKAPGYGREKVLATIVRLLETTLIRVGNEEYAKQNHSFGLTTMRTRHAEIRAGTIHFEFRGKSGVMHAIDLHDKRLAKVVHGIAHLPGQELFQYLDESGQRHPIHSDDVNAYLQAIAGEEFTAKDFRTWAGTVLAAMALQEFEACDSESQAKRNIVAAIESVAKKLGNTKAVCRKCYIHPAILDSYLSGEMLQTLKERVENKLRVNLHYLKPEEAAVLALLQERLKRETRARKAG
jgi:DNA topoisomerase I